MKQHIVTVGNISIANNLPLVLIAGPCQMESREHALEMAEALSYLAQELNIKFIYKSSFDKANRTNLKGRRGIGLASAMPIFAEIKEKFGCPVITDVHNEAQCAIVAEVADILQIPAFLCRQTDLLLAAAATGKIVNVKKGQFVAPWDVKNIVEKIESSNNRNILLTDRGTSFGYNNLVVDMRGIPVMAKTGYPVIFDATHAVQQPGGLGSASGGQREFVETLAKAAVAVGLAGIFLETHQDPDNAPSDGPCMVHLKEMPKLISTLIELDRVIKKEAYS